MSEGLNRVTLLGNVGADPELKYGQGGGAVLKLRMATNESWLKDGERQERTEWHTVIFFGKRAEGLSRVLEKGSRVLVEGRLQTRSWEDRDGNKRWTTEVVASNLVFAGGGRGGQQNSQQSRGGSGRQDMPADDFGPDDIPF